MDVPDDGATVSGYVNVQGFALDGNLVSNVDVFVDGTDDANRVTTAGGANINLPRPDILQAFPQYAGTPGQYPGWRASFKASSFSNGSHTIYVQITDVNGCTYFLTPKAIKVDNTANQPPFGNMDFPQPNSSVCRERRPHGRRAGRSTTARSTTSTSSSTGSSSARPSRASTAPTSPRTSRTTRRRSSRASS